MAKVVVLRCEGYDEARVASVVRKGIDTLGGPSAFARRGEKILIKPNWLAADPPEKCTCTHPSVFKAVCELFIAAGARLTYGDSPAFQRSETAAKKAGFSEVAEKLSIRLADFLSGKEVFFKGGVQNKKFAIANGVLDSDGVISLPKLKSHQFQVMTGAVKNQFGCIPGALKGEFHVKVFDAFDFARMLVDLTSYVHPRLYIMDAIVAMEGNGPRGGNPKPLNALLFSVDPIALDATACRIIGLDPESVPTIKAGHDAGAGEFRSESIELLGDKLDGFIDPSFDIQRKPAKTRAKGLKLFAQNALVPKPYITAEKCIKCGVCVTVCPVTPKALNWREGNKNRPPAYNYKKCIRCYCCQELCPQSAIRINVPILRRLFLKKRRGAPIRLPAA